MFLDTLRRKPLDPILRFRAALEKIQAEKSLSALLNLSLKEALHLVQAEVGSLFLVDENKKELVLKGASGEYLSHFPEVRRKIDEGILGYVASRQSPILVEDIRNDFRFQNGNGFSHYRTTSFLSVPIVFQGKLLGILNLTDKKSKRPFVSKDLEWMTLFASCVAEGIARMHLGSDLKKSQHDAEDARKTALLLMEEKRQLGTELELSQKMASIGKLAAGIAHELNNPLDGTLRYIHLSLSHLRENDLVREYLLEVKQGLTRMVNIVKNLLTFSSRQRVTMKPVDVNEALEDVLSNMNDYFYTSRVQVIKAYHPALPLLLDKGIDQIFTNIIKNALEAMPHGGTLRIATLHSDHEITVRISDTGHGIAKENRPYIFDPFFTTKEIDKGCGLGLSICYELVRSYGGRIEVESEENRGATFLIHFPLTYAVSKESAVYAR